MALHSAGVGSLTPNNTVKIASGALRFVWIFSLLAATVCAASLLNGLLGFIAFLAVAGFFNLTLVRPSASSPGRGKWRLVSCSLLGSATHILVIVFLAIRTEYASDASAASWALLGGHDIRTSGAVGIVSIISALLALLSELVFAIWVLATGTHGLFASSGYGNDNLARFSGSERQLSSRYLNYRGGRPSLTSPLKESTEVAAASTDEDQDHDHRGAAAKAVGKEASFSSKPVGTCPAKAYPTAAADDDGERSSRGSGLSLPPIRKNGDESTGHSGSGSASGSRSGLDAVAEAVDSGAVSTSSDAAGAGPSRQKGSGAGQQQFRVVTNRTATQSLALALFGLLAASAIFQLTSVGVLALCLALLALLEFGLLGRRGRWLCLSSCSSRPSATSSGHLSSSSSFLLRDSALFLLRLYSFVVMLGLFAAQVDWDGATNNGNPGGQGCPTDDGSLPVQLGFICSFTGSAGSTAWPYAVSYCCLALLHLLAGLTQQVFLPSLIQMSLEAAQARRLYHHYHQHRASAVRDLDQGPPSSSAAPSSGAFLLNAGSYRNGSNADIRSDLPVVSSLSLASPASRQRKTGAVAFEEPEESRTPHPGSRQDGAEQEVVFTPSAAAFLSPTAANAVTPSAAAVATTSTGLAADSETPKPGADDKDGKNAQPQRSLVQRVTSSTKAAVRMVILFLFGSDVGFGLVTVAVLCWSTAFPSLLTLPPMLWVLLCGFSYSHYTPGHHHNYQGKEGAQLKAAQSREKWVSRLSRLHAWLRSDLPLSFILWFIAAVSLVQYCSALYAIWTFPSLFDPAVAANEAGAGSPWASSQVQGLYNGAAGLVGLAPLASSPSYQQLYHLCLLALLGAHLRCRAVFVKEKGTKEEKAKAEQLAAAAVTSADSNADASHGVHSEGVYVALADSARGTTANDTAPGTTAPDAEQTDDGEESEDDDGPAEDDGGMLAEDENSSVFMDEAEAARLAYQQIQEQLKETGRILWTLGQSWLVFIILVALYLLSLFSVDLVHSCYFLFIVVFAINPRIRRERWRWLIGACAIAITLMFLLDIIALNIFNGAKDRIPPWVAGSEIVDPGTSLWNIPFTTNLAIFLLCVVQAPHYDRECSGEHALALEQLYSRQPWIPAAEKSIVRLQVRYGSWVVYLAFVAISLVPPVELMSLTTLILVSVGLTLHLFHGVSRSTRHLPAMRAVGRFLLVLAIVEGVFLSLRYLYQFTPIAHWFEDTIGPHLSPVLKVVELGLCNESIDNGSQQKCPSNLYVDLLDTTALFFMAVMQQRAVFSAIALQKKKQAAALTGSQSPSVGAAAVAGHERHDSINSTTSSKGLLSSATASSSSSSASAAAAAQPTPAGGFAFPLNAPAATQPVTSLATWEEETAQAIARWTYKRSPGLAQASLAALAALLVACITSSLPIGTSAGAAIAVLVVLLVTAILVHDLRRHGAHSHRLRQELKVLRSQGLIMPPAGLYEGSAPTLQPSQVTTQGSDKTTPTKKREAGTTPTAATAAKQAPPPTVNRARPFDEGDDDRATATVREQVGCWRWFWYKLCCGCCCSPRRATSPSGGDGESSSPPTCGTVLKRFFRHTAHLLRHFLYRHSGQITMVTGFAVATTNVDAMSFCLTVLIILSTLFTGLRESWQACGGCRRCSCKRHARNPAVVTSASPLPTASQSRHEGPLYSPLSGGDQQDSLSGGSASNEAINRKSRRASTDYDGSADGHGAEKREEDRLLSLLRSIHHGAFLSSSYSSTSAVSKASFYWAWLPLLVGVWIAILFKYAYQFSFFGHHYPNDGTGQSQHWYSGGTAMTEWLGLYRLDFPAASAANPSSAASQDYTYSGMWALLGPYLWIVIACALQRWSSDFGVTLLAEEAEDLEILSRALDGLDKQPRALATPGSSASNLGVAGGQAGAIVNRRASIRLGAAAGSAPAPSLQPHPAATAQQAQQLYYYHGHAYPSYSAALMAQRSYDYVFMSLIMALGIEEIVGGSGGSSSGITRSAFTFSSTALAARSASGGSAADSSSLTVADVSLLRQLSRPVHGRGLLPSDVPLMPLPYLWTERRMAAMARGVVSDADAALLRSSASPSASAGTAPGLTSGSPVGALSNSITAFGTDGRSISVGSLKDNNKNARMSLAINSRAVISFASAQAAPAPSSGALPAFSPSLRQASSNLLVSIGPSSSSAAPASNVASISPSNQQVSVVVDWYQRALQYRRFIGVTEGADKLSRKYGASLAQDATVIALVFSALLLLNAWGIVQCAFAFLALRPWSSPSTAAVQGSYDYQQKQRGKNSKAATAAELYDDNLPVLTRYCSRYLWPSESFVRHWLWPALRLYLAVMLLVLYAACLGWYPSIDAWTGWWPWTMSPQWQYWLAGIGLNGFGSKPLGMGADGSGNTYFLFPAYVALLFAGAASKQWASIDAARRRSVEATTAALAASSTQQPSSGSNQRISSSTPGLPFAPSTATAPSVPVVLTNGNAPALGASSTSSVEEAPPAPSGVSTLPAASSVSSDGIFGSAASKSNSSFGSDWDRLQYLVSSTSAHLLLIAIFIIAAVNSFQDLFLVGYCFISLFFLYAPRYYTKKGNAVLGWIRLYTLVVLLLNLFYQIPAASVPQACTIINNSPGPNYGQPIVVDGFCLSWQSLFGFRKLSSFVPAVPPTSNANFTYPPSSANPSLWNNGANPLCPTATPVGGNSGSLFAARFAVHEFFVSSSVAATTTAAMPCPNPFNAGAGLLTSFLLVILGIVQAYLFDSSAYACSQDLDLAEGRLAATRRALNDALRKQRQIDKNTEGKAEAAARERRLQRLIDRCNKWELSQGTDPMGAPLCPPAVKAKLWPPAAPAKILAVKQVDEGAIKILWLPPVGYEFPSSLLPSSNKNEASGIRRRLNGKAVATADGNRTPQTDATEDDDNKAGLDRYLIKRQQSRRLMASKELPSALDLGFVVRANKVASNVGSAMSPLDKSEDPEDSRDGARFGDWEVVAAIPAGETRVTATTVGLSDGQTSTQQCFTTVVRDLEENCCYEFQVCGRSDLGLGPYSEASFPIVIQPPMPSLDLSAAGEKKPANKVTLVFEKSKATSNKTVAIAGEDDDLLGIRSPTADTADMRAAAASLVHDEEQEDSGEATADTITATATGGTTTRARRSSVSSGTHARHKGDRRDSGGRESDKGSVIFGLMGQKAESVVMAGAEDVQRCCGCERGCGGWIDWCFFKVETLFLPKVDRLLFPRPVASFKKGMSDCSGVFCCGAGSSTSQGSLHQKEDEHLPLIAQQGKAPTVAVASLGTESSDGLSAARGLLYLAATGAQGIDDDWEVEKENFSFFPSRIFFILYCLYLAVISHSQLLVLTAIIIYTCVSASLISCVMALLLFFHLLAEYPRPGHKFWGWCSRYVLAVIILKFLFQLPIFCLQMHVNPSTSVIDGQQWYPRLWFDCQASAIGAATAQLHVQIVSLIGISKYSSLYGGNGFLSGLWADLLLLVALLFHRSMLQKKGLWKTAKRADSRILRKAVESAYGLQRSSAAKVAERIVEMGTEGAVAVATGEEPATQAAVASMQSPFAALAKQDASAGDEEGEEGGPNKTPESAVSALAAPSPAAGSHHKSKKPTLAAAHLESTKEDDDEAEDGDEEEDGDDESTDGDTNEEQAAMQKPSVMTGLSHEPGKGLTPRYSVAGAATGVASASSSFYQSSEEPSSSSSSCKRCCCGGCCCGCFPLRASLKRMLTPPSGQPNVKAAGRDLYVWAFSIQLVILLYIIAAPAINIDNSTNSMSVVQQLSNNQFSGSMVLYLIAMIALIVVERVAYLLRSHQLKLTIHVITVLVVHFFVLFAIPWVTNRPFGSNPQLIVFYLLWAGYFCLGAMQLHHGYETRPPRDSLKSSGFNAPMPLLFTLYLSVPFLHELQQILSWVCTPTSLDLPQWMRLEAIHTQLFLVQSDMVSRQRNKKEWYGKLTQSNCYKFWCGTIIFLGLLLVIIGPALLFSTLNPTLSLNPVTAVGLQLELAAPDEGTFPIFSTTHYQSLGSADNPQDYQYLSSGANYFSQLQQNATINGLSPIADSWKDLTQQMQLYPFPLSEWTLSPPALNNLVTLLTNAVNNTGTAGGSGWLPDGSGAVNPSAPTGVAINFQVAFTRDQPVGNQVITTSYSIPLTAGTCAQLVQVIVAGTTTAAAPSLASSAMVAAAAQQGSRLTQVMGSGPVSIPQAYPLALRLPATGSALALGEAKRSMALTLHRLNPNSTNAQPQQLQRQQGQLGAQPYYSSLPLWWTLQLSSQDPFAGGNATAPVTGLSGLVFNLISDKVAPSVLVSSFGGYSVLAVYVTLVLAVGRLIRSAWGSDPARVPVEEMTDCTDLLELCRGVKEAQRASYEGCHVDEMTLYRVLVRIFRSPEMLLKITAAKKEW